MLEISFEERLDLVARLGIKVYLAEDLKSRRIKSGMNIRDIQKTGEQDRFVKMVYSGAGGTIGRTFELVFSLTI